MAEPSFLTATRSSYDAIADDYALRFHEEIASKPLERALLVLFAELVRARGGPVLDVGCGGGQVTARLRDLGLDASGLDLSPGMLAVARREHPGLEFREGSMTGLDVADGSLGGIVAMYSTIHVPLAELPGVFAGFRRALAPGGECLLAFQAGEGVLRMDEAFGHEVRLDFHRRTPEAIADLLEDAGLQVHIRTWRARDRDERTPHAFLIARRPV
ncbi:methyltransferase [Nocardiopsis sp. CNR-923]|uniref:class I SAM-dependent DNA methyltransferase n=1 Tax=Nocardiopsis sp. CNR-923 TaxID=1904965 RepID=UPI0009697527|nr:class I SAM-dependent methyltransferase [Nocardiopsis sp. CNR-923]OLT29245.1 methyltransferase [Nocardiopsis sp. CNR-923]